MNEPKVAGTRQRARAELVEKEINVRLGSSRNLPVTPQDTFDVDITKIAGLKPSVKKRASRIEKRAEGYEGARSTRVEWDDVGAYNLLGIVQPGFNMDYLARLYIEDPTHYAAVKTKVSHIVGLGFDFVESHKTRQKVDRATGPDRVNSIRRNLERHKNDIYDWIDSCNQDDTITETLMKVITDYEATGNGYLEIGRTVFGEIGYIGHIPATTIRLRKERDGFVQMVSNKAVFFRNFGDLDTDNPVGDEEPNEIMHFKKYSPTSGYYGVPDIISALPAVAGNRFANIYNLDYFENKAVPRYVIIVKGGNMSSASENSLIEFFEGVKGKNHRTIYIPLPADTNERKVSFEMKPVEAGTQDSSFGDYRKANISDILTANRVPISKVSAAEGMGLAAARDADKTFSTQVVEPEQLIIEKKINKLVAEKTEALRFKLIEMSLSDEQQRAAIDQTYLATGVYVPNEVRAKQGLPAREGGDDPIILSGQQQADMKAEATNSRERDTTRAANRTDSTGEARNTQGEGRTTA